MLKKKSSLFYREDLPIWQFPNGQKLTVPIFRFSGSSPKSPSAYIQANIHGSEVQGNAIIYCLLEHFIHNPPKGDVTLVPCANPFASTQKSEEHSSGRHDSITGQNWNRHYLDLIFESEEGHKFPEQIDLRKFVDSHIRLSWEKIKISFRKSLREALRAYRMRKNREGIGSSESIALSLQEMALEADCVIDLHTSPLGARYAYAPEYAKRSACFFQIPYLLLMPNRFDGALDEATFCPWWKMYELFFSKGRLDIPLEVESYTLEYGNQGTLCLEKAFKEAQGILSYLSYRKVVENLDFFQSGTCFSCKLEDYLTLYSQNGGFVDYHADPGKEVEKGEHIASVLDLHSIRNPEDIRSAVRKVRSPEKAIILLRYAFASVHSGTELFKVMTKLKKIEAQA